VTVYVERRMTSDAALRSLDRAERDPPDTFVETDGRASATGVTDAIDGYADEDPEFGQLVDESALDDGPPNRNLDRIYGELRDSGYADFTGEYLADDSRSTRVVYDVESDASDAAITADAREVADRYRGDATATGQIVVFQAVSETIFSSAIVSLSAALGLSALLLIVLFRLFLGSPALGLVTLLPVAVTVATLTATMRLAGIPFNALTATILSITIGLGVDYGSRRSPLPRRVRRTRRRRRRGRDHPPRNRRCAHRYDGDHRARHGRARARNHPDPRPVRPPDRREHFARVRRLARGVAAGAHRLGCRRRAPRPAVDRSAGRWVGIRE